MKFATDFQESPGVSADQALDKLNDKEQDKQTEEKPAEVVVEEEEQGDLL